MPTFMTFRFLFLVTLVFSFPHALLAQFGNTFGGEFPATVSAKMYATDQADVSELVVTVAVQDGYYTYGMDPLIDPEAFGPVPTSLGFTGGEFFEPVEDSEWKSDKPKVKFDEGFETEVRYHEGTTKFRREFTILETPAETEKFSGYIMLQICDDKICLPPKRVPFDVVYTGEKEPSSSPMPAEKPDAESAEAEANVSNDSEETANEQTGTEESSSDFESESIPMNLPVDGADDEGSQQSGLQKLELKPEEKKSSNATASVKSLSESNLFAVAGLAFLAGILSLLTPCVFPMIPITISFFTKRSGKSSKDRILLVSAYSGSIVVGFSVLGFGLALALSLLGFGDSSAGLMNVIAAHPLINLALAIFFVIFAFSLFGAFEISLPSSWANKLQKKKGQRADIVGAMLMAMIFVLISFTCTAPIVGPLIVLTVQGGVMLPAIGLTFYAIGFALPFFILGLVPGALSALPKSGGWLNATKVTLGLLELGIALIYFAKADLVLRWGIFTREILLSAWVGISLVTALYLLGVFKLKTDSEKESIGGGRLAFSILFATMAMYFAYGLFAGRIHSDLEALLPRSLDGSPLVAKAGGGEWEEPEFIMNDLEKAQALSREQNKPLFIDFTGWTCTNCQRNAVDVFPRPEVKELMEQYILVALYTDDPDTGEKWMKYQNERFNTFSLPFYATLTPDDELIATYGGLIREGQREEFKDFLRLGLDQQIAFVSE